MSEFDVNVYYTIVGLLKEEYDLSIDVENKYIHEFFEGSLPVFKLMYVKNEDRDDRLLVSFHLDLTAVEAIQWFLRIRHFNHGLMLTQSYCKDDNGETFLGPAAEQIRMYRIQQEALAEYVGDIEGAKKAANSKIVGRKRPYGRDWGYIDEHEATQEFSMMQRDKDKDKLQ